MATVAAMTLAWLSPTSLGSAVVPDVRIRIAGASTPPRRRGTRGVRPSLASRPGQVITVQSLCDVSKRKPTDGMPAARAAASAAASDSGARRTSGVRAASALANSGPVRLASRGQQIPTSIAPRNPNNPAEPRGVAKAMRGCAVPTCDRSASAICPTISNTSPKDRYVCGATHTAGALLRSARWARRTSLTVWPGDAGFGPCVCP